MFGTQDEKRTVAQQTCNLRNPWVAGKGGEGGTSSNQQQTHEAQTNKHEAHVQTYATTFQPLSSQNCHASTSLTTTVTPAAVSSRASNHVLCNQEAVASHGMVHSHAAHSLHSTSHPGTYIPATTHTVSGAFQQSWMEPKFMKDAPVLPARSGLTGGVFTVGGRNEITCPGLQQNMYNHHHAKQHSFQHTQPEHALYSGREANTWRGLAGASGWESSRCEKCHYYCFLTAQMMFVTGIVVLVYIGALVSLVCVLLLVIFCAMGRDHRPRRSRKTSVRYLSCPQVLADSEAVPLQSVETINPHLMLTGEGSHTGEMPQINSGDMGVLSSTICMANPVDHNRFYLTPVSHRECTLGTGNHKTTTAGPTNHKAAALFDSHNHGPHAVPIVMSEMSPHVGHVDYSTKR
ncbi:uncharacterized protein LOC122242581 isoform X2 [Penaeus japonicus]|uniref:uncharacterized protein LOC122242581 isoform X2 n=1 Tax=Penaeus japonicus TaxID=27405 RepID=UPI001C710B17|nr:uncharacterized protein LOC122242581 isoform X2 [Penaeus japonicus]